MKYFYILAAGTLVYLCGYNSGSNFGYDLAMHPPGYGSGVNYWVCGCQYVIKHDTVDATHNP